MPANRLSIARRTHSPNRHRYRDVVNGDGPVGYWRMGDLGTPLVDASGHGNNGATAGSAWTWNVPGAIANDPDGALVFPATSGNYCYVNNIAHTAVGDVFTLEMWIKRNVVSTNQYLWDLGNGNGGYPCVYLDPTNLLTLRAVSTGNLAVASTALTDTTQFHHIVVVKNGSSGATLYIDGANVTNTGASGVANHTFASVATYWEIGGYQNASQAPFNGTIDEVALYGTALTATQVQNHYTVATAAA